MAKGATGRGFTRSLINSGLGRSARPLGASGIPSVTYSTGTARNLQQFAETMFQASDRFEANLDREAQAVSTEQGRVEGSEGTYQPRDYTTLRNRAYNQAGQQSFVSGMETRSIRKVSELSTQYGDDPVKLQSELEAYSRGVEKTLNQVVPGTGTAFSDQFAVRTAPNIERARDARVALSREAADAALIESEVALQAEIKENARDLFSGNDKRSEAAMNALRQSQGQFMSIFNAVDQATGRPLFSAAEKAKAKAEFMEGVMETAALSWFDSQPDKASAYLEFTGQGLPVAVQSDGSDAIPNSYYRAIRAAESGGNDAARNPRSTATGRYQFIQSTWDELAQRRPDLKLTPNGRLDAGQQERAVRAFTQENATSLRSAGIPVTNGTLYAAHFLGDGGAVRVLRRPEQERVSDIVGPDVVRANPFLRNMSVGGFKRWASKKGGGTGKAGEVEQAAPRRVARSLGNVPIPAHFSEADVTELNGVESDLVRVALRAAELTDVRFKVGDGTRTEDEQRENVRKGWSKTMNSRHLVGRAIDLHVLGEDGEATFDDRSQYVEVSRAMKQAAKELGIPIEWGGDWKSFDDIPHFQVPRDYEGSGAYQGEPSTAGGPVLRRGDDASVRVRDMLPANVASRVEAEMRARISFTNSLADRAERQQEEAAVAEQETTAFILTDMLYNAGDMAADGTVVPALTDDIVREAIETRALAPQAGEALLRALAAETPLQTDQGTYQALEAQIYDGGDVRADILEASERLTTGDRSTLLRLNAQEVRRREPGGGSSDPLTPQDKRNRSNLAAVMRPQGLSIEIDPKHSLRIGSALDEFDRRVIEGENSFTVMADLKKREVALQRMNLVERFETMLPPTGAVVAPAGSAFGQQPGTYVLNVPRTIEKLRERRAAGAMTQRGYLEQLAIVKHWSDMQEEMVRLAAREAATGGDRSRGGR